MATIRHPFGGEQGLDTLTKINATASGSKDRTISAAFSFLRCATATQKKTLTLTIEDTVPVGAVLLVNAQSAASAILLSTGFASQEFIGGKTTNKATGNWIQSFIYNGSGFYPLSGMSKLNTSKSS
jgi:hypothetical protein